jgi:hypothetical protein
MAESKAVTLAKPIVIKGRQPITEITLREPTFSDLMDFGEPETLIGLNEGAAGYFQEDIGVIRKYAERLADIDPNYLAMLGLRDALQVKRVIVGFFRAATRETTPVEEASSSESPENLSSDTDSQFTPSKL